MNPGRALGPAVAGQWYPSGEAALREQVRGLLSRGREDLTRTGGPAPIALVVPHAGYMYSGEVAGRGFAMIEAARFERVILLGPSHYAAFRGGMLPESAAYRTPLGEVPFDLEAIEALRGEPGFARSDRPYRPEHSLEAEIPFLQVALPPGFRLLPVLVGSGSMGAPADAVARALREFLGEQVLVVVSSDFTHYGARFGYVPFHADVPDRIRAADMEAIRRIESADASGFEDYMRSSGLTVCGRDAIAVLLRLLPPRARGRLVAYDTSGRMTGDWTHSVSYASIAFDGATEERASWTGP